MSSEPLGVIRERRATRGFTLIELLVVTGILAVVIGAIGACLAGGIRVWDVARRFNRHEADGHIGFRLMRRDFGAVLPFEGAPFAGERDGCVFSAVTYVYPAGEAGEAVPRLARVRYFLDRDREAWCRAVAPFDWEDVKQEAVEVLVSDVDAVTLRYGAPPDAVDGAAAGWSDDWANPSNLPAVVEAELTIADDQMTQWFMLPLAGQMETE